MRDAGLRWLKPIATAVERGRRAVVVECLALKPCCEEFVGKDEVMKGRRSFSKN